MSAKSHACDITVTPDVLQLIMKCRVFEGEIGDSPGYCNRLVALGLSDHETLACTLACGRVTIP